MPSRSSQLLGVQFSEVAFVTPTGVEFRSRVVAEASSAPFWRVRSWDRRQCEGHKLLLGGTLGLRSATDSTFVTFFRK